jgi:hypothetical protein
MTPIFKNSEIEFENIGEYMQITGSIFFSSKTFQNACCSPKFFRKMSFGEAVFVKSHFSYLEKLRGNRDWHSVASEHVSVVFSGRNAEGGVH